MGNLAPTWENVLHIFAMAASEHGSRKLISLLAALLAPCFQNSRAIGVPPSVRGTGRAPS